LEYPWVFVSPQKKQYSLQCILFSQNWNSILN